MKTKRTEKTSARFVVAAIALILLMFGIWATMSVARGEVMYVTVEDGPLRGRSKPSLGAGVECRFDDQEPVDVLSMADGWAQLNYGGEAECSYVSWDYLTDNDDTEYIVRAPGGLNIRNNPDGDRVIGKLKDGAMVGVVFTFDGWAKIKKGWVHVRYLEPVGLDLGIEEE